MCLVFDGTRVFLGLKATAHRNPPHFVGSGKKNNGRPQPKPGDRPNSIFASSRGPTFLFASARFRAGGNAPKVSFTDGAAKTPPLAP